MRRNCIIEPKGNGKRHCGVIRQRASAKSALQHKAVYSMDYCPRRATIFHVVQKTSPIAMISSDLLIIGIAIAKMRALCTADLFLTKSMTLR